MKNIFVVLMTSLIVGCSNIPHSKEQWVAYNNFTYQSDINDEWYTYPRIDKPFVGDCEDFALTLQKQIGGEVWYVILPDSTPHAVLLSNRYVYDNLHKIPILKTQYKAFFVKVLR